MGGDELVSGGGLQLYGLVHRKSLSGHEKVTLHTPGLTTWQGNELRCESFRMAGDGIRRRMLGTHNMGSSYAPTPSCPRCQGFGLECSNKPNITMDSNLLRDIMQQSNRVMCAKENDL